MTKLKEGLKQGKAIAEIKKRNVITLIFIFKNN
jgi:hypothetical protein